MFLNILKPEYRKNESWPKCSYFAIYDGYNGSFASDFLRDNLHKYIMKEWCFPYNPIKALTLGFAAAEKEILNLQINKEKKNSGSCALVVLIVGEMCYVANLGDSRGVLGMYFMLLL